MVVLTAAAYAGVLGAASPPAAAATCPTAEGVSVVVDFNDLGGGVQEICDASGGGEHAATLFTRNGYALTYVQRQPGFVCRINDVPAEDPCVNTPPADAYWGLWWSDGTTGTWSYSTLAAGSLKIPEGGYVAFSWNQGAGKDKPSSKPTAHAQPSATPTSSGGGGGGNDGGNNAGGGNGSGGNRPSAKPTPTPSDPSPTSTTPSANASASPAKPAKTEKPRRRPTSTADGPGAASPSADPGESVTSDPVDADARSLAGEERGIPFWVVLLVIATLFSSAAGIAVVRRRRHGDRLGP